MGMNTGSQVLVMCQIGKFCCDGNEYWVTGFWLCIRQVSFACNGNRYCITGFWVMHQTGKFCM